MQKYHPSVSYIMLNAQIIAVIIVLRRESYVRYSTTRCREYWHLVKRDRAPFQALLSRIKYSAGCFILLRIAN